MLRYLRSVVASLGLLAVQAFAAAPCPTISVGPLGPLPGGAQQIPYSATFTASGSSATPYGFQITSGLPAGSGLSMNPSTGVLSGTPTLDGLFHVTITARDQNGCTGGRKYELDIRPAVLDTVPANGAGGVPATSTVKIDFTESVHAIATAFSLQCPSGTPIAYTVSPALPADASTFTLTPNANLPANATCTGSVIAQHVTATAAPNLHPAADYPFTFSTGSLPTITSANATTFTVGTPGTFGVTTTGTPAPSITRGGVALPGGVTFTDNGNGTGTLAGNPAAGSGGIYAITFTANNSSGSSPTQNFTLTINEAPSITSANATSFAIGTAGTFGVTTTGFPKPTITRGGVALPSNVTFTDNANGTGTLAGTPASGTGGTYALTFTASNGVGGPANQNFTFSVVGATSTTALALTTGTNPSVYGQSLTFTATVSGSGGTPTGTVTFKDGAITLGTGTLNGSGVATFTTSTLGAGSHSITAVYGGDSSFATSTSAPLSQTVNQASTTTTVATGKSPTVFGEAVTFTATVAPIAPGAGIPTGTVTFTDTTTSTTLGTGSVNGSGQATLTTGALTTGAHTIQASYGGDTNFSGSNGSIGQTVNQGATTTTVATTVTPSVYGQSVTFTATVTPTAPSFGTPTGIVTFQDGGSTIGTGSVNGSGQATLTTSALSVASHSITAIYAGDTNFTTSTSSALTQTVSQANTTTTLISSVNPSTISQSVTFTATVAAVSPGAGLPTGTVTFNDGATFLASVALNASAQALYTTSTLGVGPHSITAVYSGDANFITGTGGPLTQTVNLNASSTTLTSSQNPSVFGQSVTLTATVSGSAGIATGTVDFLDNGSPIATNVALVAGVATFTTDTLSVASHPLTAVYSGDTTYGSSTSNLLTQTVNQADTTTTVTADVNPSLVGQMVTFTITVAAVAPGAGTPTGTITDLSVDGTTIAPPPTLTLDGSGQVTFATNTLAVGSHSVTATYSGDVNFLASDNTAAPLTQQVDQASTTTTLATSKTPTVFGESVTFTATVAPVAPGGGTPTGSATIVVDGSPTTVALSSGQATLTTSSLSLGSHTVTASYAGTLSYAASSTVAPTTQQVNQASTTTSVVADVNPAVFGQTVTFTATVSATAPGSGTPTGSVVFLDNGSPLSGPVSLVGGTATLSTSSLGVGTHPITVSYAGDVNFTGSTSTVLSEDVTKVGTATALAVDVNPSVVGQDVTFTATVTSTGGTPTGSVTFFDGATPISGSVPLVAGVASFMTSSLALGNHSITAVYSGDPSFATSTSNLVTQAVNQADTTTTVTADVNPSLVGQNVTFTITVTAAAPGSGTPTGDITTLKIDGTTVAPPPTLTLDGTGKVTFSTSTLALGDHTVVATYGGDTNYLGSDNSASPFTQHVNQASTTTTLGTSGSPSVFGQSVTFTATVAAVAPGGGTPTGTVTFKDGATTLGTGSLSGGTATFMTSSLSVASHSITAAYTATPSYAASSTAAPTTQVVNKADTSTALASDLNPSKTGDTVTFTATVSATSPGAGTPTGTVTFKDGASTLGTGSLVGGVATFSTSFATAGAHTITASYGGDGNFNTSVSSGLTQNVNQPPKITSGSSTTFAPGKLGQSFQVTTTGFPTPGLSVGSAFATGVTFTDNGNGTATIAGTPAAGTQTGSPYVRTITANNGVSPNDTQNFTLNIVCPAISVSGASTLSAVFNTAMTSSGYSQLGGNGTITWTAPGLPGGVSIDSSGTISGAPSATGVFSVTVTATDAGGCQGTETVSFSSAPKAVGDSYSGMVDNTQAVVTGGSTGSPSTPFISLSGNLLTNDLPSGGVTATLGTFTTAGNGSVTIAADGTFIYTPHANAGATANTSDSFTYTVASNGVTSAPATVTLSLSNRVWYVNNNGGGSNGQSQSPFTTLAAAAGASTANDFIFVYNGNGTNSGQNAGITLKNGQQLLGEANGLLVGSLTIAAGSRPVIGNSGGDGVTITNVSGVVVKGLTVGGSANGIKILSSAAAALSATINNVFTNAVTQNGIDARTAAGAGSLVLDIDNNNVTANGSGIVIDGSAAGTTTITGFANNSITGNTVGSGVLVTSATFDATPGGTFQQVGAGTMTIGASGNGVGAAGMVLTNVSGDLGFTDLDIFADGGAGLRASGTTAYTGSAGFRIGFPGVISPVASSTAVGGPAIDLSTLAMNNFIWNLVSSTNSATTGAAFNGVTGTFSAASGSGISGSSGTGFQVGSSNATISYAGTLNTTTGKGVDLTSNTGSAISFSGAMTLSSGSSTAFNATGGGTVTATDTTSTLTSTTGTALNVASTTIGAAGLKFKSVAAGTAASGPTNGILLNNTGASGGVSVLGTGAANSGGTIQKTTGAGISLTSTTSPSFNNLNIQNTALSGISGTLVSSFALTNSTINNSGTAAAPVDDRSNVGFGFQSTVDENNVSGVVTITGNTLTNAFEHGVDIQNFAGTITNATISNNTVTSPVSSASSLGSGIRLLGFGTPSAVSNIMKATISNNTITNFPGGAGITAQYGNANSSGGPAGTWGTPGSPTNVILIQSNLIAGQSTANPMGANAILATLAGSGQAAWKIDSNGTVANPIANVGGTEIGCQASGPAPTAATCDITNNHIQGMVNVGAQAIVFAGDYQINHGEAPHLTGTISNNTISGQDGEGITVLATSQSAAVLSVSVLNNSVTAPNCSGCNRFGMTVNSGLSTTTTGGNPSVCVKMAGNTSAGSGVDTGIGIRRRSTFAFNVDSFPSPGTDPTAYLNTQNPAGGSVTNITGLTAGTCTAP